MAKTKFAFLLLMVIFIASACQYASVDTVNSNNVQSSTVYQDYRIDADRSQTRVEATFRVGGSTGTTIELGEPGRIMHNGNALSLSAPGTLLGTNYRTKGTDYRASLKGYQPNHEFVFTDTSGATYKNSLALAPLEIAAGKSEMVLRKSQPTALQLSRSVAANETLSVGLNDSATDDLPTRGNTIYLSPSRDQLIITPQYWREKISTANHNGGIKASVRLKISRRENVAQGTTVGGAIHIVYTSAPAALMIEKPGGAAGSNTKTNSAVNRAGPGNANSNGAISANVMTNTAAFSNTLPNINSGKSNRPVSRKNPRRKALAQ